MNNKIDYPLNVSAIEVSQPIGKYLIARMDWRVLESITYSDVRRIEARDIENYLGIQRPLNKKRVGEIADYIYDSKDATFPTSIIVAIDERCAVYDEKSCTLKIDAFVSTDVYDEDGFEEEIPHQRIAKVLDGQHRIAGFSEMQRRHLFEKEFQLSVAIFIGIDLPEQAKIFATVNLAQTKVNKSLVYDLEDLANTRSPHKTCHHIAVALDRNPESPFFERIKRLGVRTQGRSYEPLTQATFVESLTKLISADPIKDRNDLMARRSLKELDQLKYPFRRFFMDGSDKGDLKIYDIVISYFTAVRSKWPTAWDQTDVKGNLLPRSNAFQALMRYLKDSAYSEASNISGRVIPSDTDFLSTLSHVELEDSDFTTKNFVPGSGGQAMFYKVLTGDLTASSLLEDDDN